MARSLRNDVMAAEIPTAAVMAGLQGIDGAGSGLDADLLDGLHASAFAEIADLPALLGDRTDYVLSSGAGTLSLAKPIIRLSGTAGASFDLTLPDGAVEGQLITIDSEGDYGAHVVNLKNASAATIISGLKADVIYGLQWVDGSSTWRKAGVTPREPGAVSTFVRGNGTIAALSASEISGVVKTAVNTATVIQASATLTAAHQYVKVNGTELQLNVVQVLHTSPSTAIDITVPDSSAVTPAQMVFVLEKPAAQTGLVRILRQTNGTLNGAATAISLTSGRARVVISVESNAGTAPVCWVKGDTTEAQTLFGPLAANGQTIAGNLASIVTRSDAGTAITAAADSGAYITTGGACTIPATAGFTCTLELGADTHDLTFDGDSLDVSAAGMVAGEIFSVVVKSATTIRLIGAFGVLDETDFT